MAQHVTLGGDRIGSGNKQKVALHNYEMNSFNLEQDWKSSIAPGILYPFLKLVGTNHGTFDIDLDTFLRTLPTKGPLFGSFKLQLDIYNVPIRLYQGILHNNPVGIGLKMNQVYLPKLRLSTVDGDEAPRVKGSNDYNYQINESSLAKYMGISGIAKTTNVATSAVIDRKFNAVPFLAYYDIFKCYYANKQEEKAYVITPGQIETEEYLSKIVKLNFQSGGTQTYNYGEYDNWDNAAEELNIGVIEIKANDKIQLQCTNENWEGTFLSFDDGEGTLVEGTLRELIESGDLVDLGAPEYFRYTHWFNVPSGSTLIHAWSDTSSDANTVTASRATNVEYSADIKLQEFDLKNIDKAREILLSNNTLGSEVIIGKTTDNSKIGYYFPYKALVERTSQNIGWNAFTDNGLVVKTYQSDLFNNWLDSEMIDGENGISALSAVAVSDGAFTIDSLNFAQKLYEVLNRVAVSGGTYEDWQEAVYGEGAIRKAETPMYIGGMAAEVMFEEVISNAETKVDGDFQPLGSLGGRGKQMGAQGGHNIHVKCDEPSYIIGIVSLTPRQSVSQGNDWDMTDLESLDDLHKPGMDGIGFQDLITEQMAWWECHFTEDEQHSFERTRYSAGKQTAWINYQTALDKCFGDFAKQDGYSYMVLNRNYEYDPSTKRIKDLTTYIDPSKYNYAFAYTDIASQNFWLQIHSKVIARRKMGAQQIPNL